MTKDNSTGKNKEFYDLGKKMFDRIRVLPEHQAMIQRGVDRTTPPFKPDWNTEAVLVEEMQRMAKRIEELEALAQTQEPVGKFAKFTDGIWREVTDGSAGQPLFTAPPQREWVGLTDDELLKTYGWEFESYGQSDRDRPSLGQSIVDEAKQEIIDGLRKVEAALKEKNT